MDEKTKNVGTLMVLLSMGSVTSVVSNRESDSTLLARNTILQMKSVNSIKPDVVI